MVISSSEFGTAARLRQHTGVVAVIVAVVGFAFGAYGAYRFVDKPQPTPILLRQATEPVDMSSYDEVPGSGGVLVLLRNDGTTTVDVIDAAFARTSAAPPLYIAPASVPPGGEVNVYVAIPGKCYSSNSFVAVSGNPPPVRITVSAQEHDGPLRFVPVEVTGTLAVILARCGLTGTGTGQGS
ncbi:hypothetical protein [Actinocrinis sp.]|uniref:hypothetical protein n=1 Tax=Actinocrinis sp. TaxID=1920516 RepID=UPI002D578FA5|nr:hypothetical protein [Actinocrinis sp.]HZP49916.1 hypothetical protein [Actinocrinis sp.]